LSIGGNHLIHVLRRNVDLQILLFNNEIYGLTKGQYSPTSRRGTRSPSTPKGSVENPISAAALALGASAQFVARTVDTHQKHMPQILKRAYEHKGASLVEILQNCIVFNDKVFSHITDRSVAAERQLHLEHGKPLLYGKDNSHGLRVKPGKFELEAVTIGEDGITEADILVHDETNRTLASLLAVMEPPNLPVALGVIYCDSAPTYGEAVRQQVDEPKGEADLEELLHGGRTWTVMG
jgi:2-oxoglutarate ferredoxin oxidoreductase subunit beta